MKQRSIHSITVKLSPAQAEAVMELVQAEAAAGAEGRVMLLCQGAARRIAEAYAEWEQQFSQRPDAEEQLERQAQAHLEAAARYLSPGEYAYGQDAATATGMYDGE